MKKNKILILAAALPVIGLIWGVTMGCGAPGNKGYKSMSTYEAFHSPVMKAPIPSPVMTGHISGGGGGGHIN